MGKTGTICCEHLAGYADWVRNDGMGAPVLLVELYRQGPVVLTLTNSTIYLKCPCCFEASRRAAETRCCT